MVASVTQGCIPGFLHPRNLAVVQETFVALALNHQGEVRYRGHSWDKPFALRGNVSLLQYKNPAHTHPTPGTSHCPWLALLLRTSHKALPLVTLARKSQ